jgi:hypothetical protein
MVDVSHADHLCAYAQQELERTRQLESVLDQIHGRRQQFVAAHSEVHACAARVATPYHNTHNESPNICVSPSVCRL